MTSAERVVRSIGDAAARVPSIVSRLQLDRVGTDEFLGHAPPQPPRIYGGELAAQVLAAANETVAPDRVAHTLQVNYLAPGTPEKPLRHEVQRVRDGRSFSTRTVRLHNDSRLVLTAHIGYHVTETGLDHQLDMPAVPPPDVLPTIAEAEGHAWTRWAAQNRDIEMRAIAADLDDRTGRRRFWLRIVGDVGDDVRLHTALTAYLSDFTMVASIRIPHEPPSAKQYLMSTLSHSLYFHRAVRADQWLLIDHYSPAAAGGRGLSLAHIYSGDGALVVSAAQEGLVRPLPEDYT